MSYIGNQDFLIEVQKGNVAGHSLIHKFGRNDSVGTSFEQICLLSTPIAFPMAPSTIRIKAGGNAADAAAGLGARAVVVEGIDDSFNRVTESIITAGASASSATTALFWRVDRAWVSSAGTYTSANTGDMTIETTGGPADVLKIGAELGQSQAARWSVPTGKTAYLLGAFVTVETNKVADLRLFIRKDFDDVTTPFSPTRIKAHWNGIADRLPFQTTSPGAGIAAKSDIWFEAMVASGTAIVTVDFELLVVDD